VLWTYEWPLKKKAKWQVKRLRSRRQQQGLRRWLRHAENLSDTEEEVVYICEQEIGRHLSDEEEVRSDEDLINCQVGNGRISVEGLIYCQGSSAESSNCQVGNEMRSIDLIDCQVGKNEVPNCQVHKGKEMRLFESLRSSEVSSDQ
jgi:hypothetical protein